MLKTIKKLIMTLSLSTLLVAPVLTPAVVYAEDNIQGNLCDGINLNVTPEPGASDSCDDGTQDGGVQTIIRTIINFFSIIVGFVSVIMIIIGGLKYITSGGDSGNITGAKNTILYAVIGLVVVALAQIIVRFVLTQATKNLS